MDLWSTIIIIALVYCNLHAFSNCSLGDSQLIPGMDFSPGIFLQSVGR